MSFWIAVVILIGITLFLLASPLWRKPKEQAVRAEYDLNVFKDQLKELDGDVERGMITLDEAEIARIEVQRRLLAADDARQESRIDAQGLSKTSVIIAGLAGVCLVVGSLALYAKLGQPGYEDVPFASRDLDKEQHETDTNGMAEGIVLLNKQLEKDPTDIDSWILLARTLRTVGRVDEALDAFKNAVKHSNRHPAILADFAEARIYAADGLVDRETEKLLLESLKQDSTQMKAQFYWGYALVRMEDFEGAVQTWVNLLAVAPKEAAWVPQVHEQLKQAADTGGLDVNDFKPTGEAAVLAKKLKLDWETQKTNAPGPTQEDMKNAAEMSQEDRTALIRSMVEGLAVKLEDNPNDLEGWKRIARAYQVMGDVEKAAAAEARIKELTGG